MGTDDLFARLRHGADGPPDPSLVGIYLGSGKPVFGRPDGETPIAEDEHVAHVDAPSDPMAALRDFLLHADIGPAEPARWHTYRPGRNHGATDDD